MSAPRPGGYRAAAREVSSGTTRRCGPPSLAATRTFDEHRRASWQEIDADAWRDWCGT